LTHCCIDACSTRIGFGFNPGSALLLSTDYSGQVAANAAVSTALSGAAGGISALFTNLWIEERRTGEPSFSLVAAMNGSLSGLVAVTASCAVVEPWAAVLIGVVAGWVYLFGSYLLIRLKIDDAVNAIPVHMMNGSWGLIATGFLASPSKLELAYGTSKHAGWFYSLGSGSFDAILLANQLATWGFIVGWTMFTMLPFFVWLNYRGWLRADSLEELVGLDISYHGGMNNRDGGVKKEYIDAYNNHKGTVRKRRGRGAGAGTGGSDGWTPPTGAGDMSLSVNEEDPDTNQEAAAMEAAYEQDA
jgi:Amt family ammonium transporter